MVCNILYVHFRSSSMVIKYNIEAVEQVLKEYRVEERYLNDLQFSIPDR